MNQQFRYRKPNTLDQVSVGTVAAFFVMLALLAFALNCATVQTNPNPDSIQAVRADAIRAADGIKTGIAIVGAAGTFADTLPIPVAQKDAIDHGILTATGTTAAPGPLVKALDTLKGVTSRPGLKATITEVLALIDPLLDKLKATGNVGLIGFAVSLTAALEFARSLS